MNMKWLRSVFGIVACVAVLAGGCSESKVSPAEPAPSDDGDVDEVKVGEVATDFGVDPESKVIRVGLNVVLSGPFWTYSERIVDAQLAYWDWLNDNGGISGWTVQPVVLDNEYDTETHLENYRILAAQEERGVVMFAMSTGTPMTLATVDLLAEDSMAALPLAYYSGWADPTIGSNVFEVLPSYCMEAINGTVYMAENYGTRAAVVSLAGPYGGDGAAGFKAAASELGVEIVYDGEGILDPAADENVAEIAAAIANSGADWVWLVGDPVTTATLLEVADSFGYDGYWSGNGPSWTPWVLSTDAAPIAAERYIVSAHTTLWDPDGPPGMQEMIGAMREYRPGAVFDDVYSVGWILGYAATAILEQAVADGDLTRAGVLAAAKRTTADFEGLAPSATWNGDPDDTIGRATYLYDVTAGVADFFVTEAGTDEGSQEAGTQSYYVPGATVSDPEASNGYRLLVGPYVSDIARDWTYRPCHPQ